MEYLLRGTELSLTHSRMPSLTGIVEEYKLCGREKTGHLVRTNFFLISVPGVFHAHHYVELERVSQFL